MNVGTLTPQDYDFSARVEYKDAEKLQLFIAEHKLRLVIPIN